jgi:beta-phosphoglucomutase-like phosphatase (HAD superfamily)
MVDAVLLEWEGVLANTSSARREAMLQALREESVHFDAAQFDEVCGGLDVSAAAQAAIGVSGREDPVLAELVAMRARRAFAERLGKGLLLYPGAVAFAERISVSARTAIVTTASRSETDFFLRLANLEATISTIVTSDDTEHSVPSVGAFRKAIEQLTRVRSVRSDHVVAIVSSARGIRAAREAGIHCVAINVPAHVAVSANGMFSHLSSITIDDVARAAGIEPAERQS